MAILNTEDVITPAVEEKTYPHLWIKNMNIHAKDETTATAFFQLCPYNTDTKEILDEPKNIYIDNLWEKINESPEFQQAMEAIFEAVNIIK